MKHVLVGLFSGRWDPDRFEIFLRPLIGRCFWTVEIPHSCRLAVAPCVILLSENTQNSTSAQTPAIHADTKEMSFKQWVVSGITDLSLHDIIGVISFWETPWGPRSYLVKLLPKAGQISWQSHAIHVGWTENNAQIRELPTWWENTRPMSWSHGNWQSPRLS